MNIKNLVCLVCSIFLLQGCAAFGGAAAIAALTNPTVVASTTAGYVYLTEQERQRQFADPKKAAAIKRAEKAEKAEKTAQNESKDPWDLISSWFKQYKNS